METEPSPPIATAPRPAPGRPILPPTPDATAVERASDAMRDAVRFHLGDPSAGRSLGVPGPDVLPALLHAFRDAERVRIDYPLALLTPGDDAREHVALPIAEYIERLIASFAPGEGAKILRDNAARLEMFVRREIEDGSAPTPVAGVLGRAARTMESRLALKGASAEQLRKDIARLIEAADETDQFLPFSERAALLIALHMASQRCRLRAAATREQARALSRQLNDILAADRAKSPEGHSAETLAATVGGTSDLIDVGALSKALDASRRGDMLSTARRTRIESARSALAAFLENDAMVSPRVVSSGEAAGEPSADGAEWTFTGRASACVASLAVFDELAESWARLFAALRVARLEVNDQYDPARHDAMLELFGWRDFTREELLSLPPVLVVETGSRLGDAGITDLSRVLLSGRPINVLIAVHPALDPTCGGDDRGTPAYRFELANFGLSHREALVNQSSAARPEHLITGLAKAMSAAHPSLHVIASGLLADGSTPTMGLWLHAGAAMEGRAHPLFHYNPEAGQTWAKRFDVDTNPQPEDPWPTYDLACATPSGDQETLSLAMTYADFALTEPMFREGFRVLPPAVSGERVVPVAEYLSLDEDAAHGCVPFVWGVGDDGRMSRLVVSRALMLACRDRLGYWRTLQELAGIGNEHVREAVERQRDALCAEFDEQLVRLNSGHAAEVERVRTETAREAMSRLAGALVSTDLNSLATARSEFAAAAQAPPKASPAQPAPATEPEAPPPEPEPPAEEDTGFDEPWIDTALCTSCNDCMGINPRVFVYNANKQAIIGDAGAGTFAEIVQAAEKCPARCIHPGKPLNPKEPNLDALVERARPFNV